MCIDNNKTKNQIHPQALTNPEKVTEFVLLFPKYKLP